jgi:Ca-activated chloride channel homolog
MKNNGDIASKSIAGTSPHVAYLLQLRSEGPSVNRPDRQVGRRNGTIANKRINIMGARRLQSRIYWALLAFIILVGLWALGALYASDAPSAPKKEEGVVIKVNVNLVTTDVSIIGKPTSELNKEDFIIYDDGVAQPALLLSQDQLPIAVGLLIDASGSTRPFMPVMQLAGIAALRHLKPNDKAVLYSFFGRVRRHTDLTNNTVQVVDAFNEIEILGGGTAVYDAMVDASNYLSQAAPNSRRAIILISDDQSNRSTQTPDRVLSGLLETTTTLYNVLAQSIGNAGNGESGASVILIPQMVAETGGEYFDVRNPAGLQTALANAMLNIRKQYTLGFSPSNPGRPGTYHRLEVKLASQKHCPGCVLRTRKGYYAGTAASNPMPGVIEKPVRTPEQTDELLVRKAIMAVGTDDDFSFSTLQFNAQSSVTTDSNNKPVIKIDLQIPAQNIGFRMEEGRHVTQLRIAILSIKDSRIIETNWSGLDLRLSDETYKKCLQSGIPFSTTIPKKADKGNIRVVVYDKGNDLVGSMTIRFAN